MKTTTKKAKLKILIPTLTLLILLSLILVTTFYLYDYYRADETALACMTSTDSVTVSESNGNYIFAPSEPLAGVIFYPGGKVETESYAPLMQELAANNILAVLVPMPANLAVFGVNKADGIVEEYPEIDNWYMAGHSLGGSMAASYVAENDEVFDGLILLAAYSTADLSDTDLSVLSIYGDRDGVLNMESYEKYKTNLPDDFTEVIIEGGCHAYFGAYGEQDGDGVSEISRDGQIERTVEAVMEVVGE